MAETEMEAVLMRIEAALARLERFEPPQVPQSGIAAAYALLDERHGLLRARIEETIGRLDSLIAVGDEASA